MEINKLIDPYNRWIGRDGNKVEWIVLHYTANEHQPDLAYNEAAYNASKYFGSSAHFFVDDTSIWQSVEIENTAWHCGDNPPSRNGATNRNSIGIEMCNVYKNGKYSISDATVDNAAAFVLYLLGLFPEAKICRHYDVTGKKCPAPWVDKPRLWKNFYKRIEENRPMTPAERKEFDKLKETVEKQAAQIKDLTEKAKENTGHDKKADAKIEKVDERTRAKYHKIEDCPEYAQATIQKLVDRGALVGVKTGDLGLTDDLTRNLVITDRCGGFD